MQSVIPTSVVDNAFVPFPEGTYKGALSDCNLVSNKDETWAGLECTFTDVEPVGDYPEDGRPFTDTITIRLSGQSVLDVTDFANLPRKMYGLQLGGGLLAGLAEAFGAAIRTEEGVAVDLEAFIGDLQDGLHEAKEVVFFTRQKERSYENDEGEKVKVIDTRATRYAPLG